MKRFKDYYVYIGMFIVNFVMVTCLPDFRGFFLVIVVSLGLITCYGYYSNELGHVGKFLEEFSDNIVYKTRK